MKRILVADDSATARMLIIKCLEIIGFAGAEIIEAENGKSALLAVKAQQVDLLLTDLNMPIMDGETLLRWVKSSPKLNYLPVVVITSVGSYAKELQLLELGAYKVISKPITPADMFDALGGFVDRANTTHNRHAWA